MAMPVRMVWSSIASWRALRGWLSGNRGAAPSGKYSVLRTSYTVLSVLDRLVYAPECLTVERLGEI